MLSEVWGCVRQWCLHKVDKPKPPRCEQRDPDARICLREECGGIKGHDVDWQSVSTSWCSSTLNSEPPTTTHLLSYHDHKSCQCCATYTSNSKKLDESCNISPFTSEVLLAVHLLYVSIPKHDLFKSYLGMYIVKITGCLKRCISKAPKRVECVLIAMFLNIPTWRFYAT